MSWLQCQFHTDPTTAGELESLLEAHGALSVTLLDAEDQPLYEPGPGETPLWERILLTALFPGDTDPGMLLVELSAARLPAALPEMHWQMLDDQDWERAWMDNFSPLRFGERLWICPSWCETPDPSATNLMLDPGLAFGTGTHPTTALCLEWLDGMDLAGQDLVDYGCGSGILGIAALLLGAQRVVGVDTDPQALLATRDNCRKNAIADERFPVFLPAEFQDRIGALQPQQAAGVMANILAQPLIRLADEICALLRPGGWLLLSGILEKQAQAVTEAYSPYCEVDPAVSSEGWVRISARKREP